MNKKLFGILIIAIFIITSIGVISAEDLDSISVTAVWDDNGNDRPTKIIVELLEDGKVVDSAKLSENNSWNATFEVDGDGEYSVEVSPISGYSTSISGNAKHGFVISNSLIESEVLGAEDEKAAVDNLSQGEDEFLEVNEGDDESLKVNISDDSYILANNTGNSTNSTNFTNSTNSTDPTGDNSKSTDDKNKTKDSPKKKKTKTTTTTTTTTTKVLKDDKKDPANNTTTATADKNTGFPLIVLVIAVFAAILIPLVRKK